jgi:6-phosphofructokinase 2
MKTIATLTMNPTIDVAYQVGHVVPTHKMRTDQESYDPGGGGINVARVFVRLGGKARCYYTSGGATGLALDSLLDLHKLVRTRIAIAGHTRISASVLATESGKEYRFVPAGPTLAAQEWQACLGRIAEAECDYLVISGSLPRGVPDDFYARIAVLVRPRGIRIVLDTSGPALRKGLAGGGIFLAKPSLGELQQLAGSELDSPEAIAEAAAAIVRQGQTEYLAVTLGQDGALLAHKGGVIRLPAIPVEAKSAVGAGDSFLAAMVFAFASGWDATEAFRFGIAAGAAAVLTPGTGLSQPDDIQRLYASSARAVAPVEPG